MDLWLLLLKQSILQHHVDNLRSVTVLQPHLKFSSDQGGIFQSVLQEIQIWEEELEVSIQWY